MNQEAALKILKSGKNAFLTGIAGAGKTYVLNQFISHLREKDISVGITASTGIAATGINGRTIHSFSGLGIRNELTPQDINELKVKKGIAKRIKKISVLIIDEISMFSGEQLNLVDRIFKGVRDNPNPFGGVQVVFCGDFLQLPPIGNRPTFAFNSRSWVQAEPIICYLAESYRQKDESLLHVLNAIRNDLVTDEIKQKIYQRANAVVNDPVRLFTHNEDVDAFNRTELAKIKEKSFFYEMWAEGEEYAIETLKRSCLSPQKLEVKKGAKVMVTRNIFKLGLVNGTLARVVECHRDFIVIKTNKGKTVELDESKWSILNERGVETASIYQIPLRLAYAITVHKSQGMTLDSAVTDLSRVFQAGQGYVALSRLRSINDLSIEGMVNDKTFVVDKECLEYEKMLMERG